MDIPKYLDELLVVLYKSRLKPIKEREPIKVDEFLNSVVHSDRHEDFIGLMQILIEDNHAMFIQEKNYETNVSKYADCLITVKGSYFLEIEGGYQKKVNQEKLERLRAAKNEKTLANATFWIAIGTIAIAIDALMKIFRNCH